MIYRKTWHVMWYNDRIEVELEPYRYTTESSASQQQAMETTCERFNDAILYWRDGRALRITVAVAD